MTSFSKNPHTEVRKLISRVVFKSNLNQTLNKKFGHKPFSERFAMANTAFTGMSFIAQIASLSTAFAMLSYLFASSPTIVRVSFSVALLLMIEMVKRESTNDVMKGFFQYREVDKFPALLAVLMVGTSIYISLEGAKVIPNFYIADAVELLPEPKSPEDIKAEYEAKVETLTKERENYIKTRLYHGRIRTEDSEEVMRFNQRIEHTEHKKDSALQNLDQKNQEQEQAILAKNKAAKQQIQQDRLALGDKLVVVALVFEIIFLLSLYFSWWYYTECEKERQKDKAALTPDNSLSPTSNTEPNTKEVEQLETVGVRATKKISFKDYELEQPDTSKTTEQKTKKDYTRICPQCGTPFVHKTHNHTYCSRPCMIAARERRNAKK